MVASGSCLRKISLLFLLLTAYYLFHTTCLHSFPNAVSTVDVRILEIFHPKELTVTTSSDTFSIALVGNSLLVNSAKKTMFFSMNETTIAIKDKIKRTYRGTIKIYPLITELIIINRVSIEHYCASVVGAEIGTVSFEAQKAQAIVSRTYLFGNLKRHNQYDFCDLTHCQVYKGQESETDMAKNAVEETEGMFIWDGNTLAEVYYHSTCGGKTANPSSIFKEANESLISVSDSNYCEDSPHYRWEWNFSYEDAPFKELLVLKRALDGRVTEIKVNGVRENGWKFRMRIGHQFGWNKLRSSWFFVEKKDTCFLFKGKGLGHGLGMCQWGAKTMAAQGKTCEEILKHYFPKLEVRQ